MYKIQLVSLSYKFDKAKMLERKNEVMPYKSNVSELKKMAIVERKKEAMRQLKSLLRNERFL